MNAKIWKKICALFNILHVAVVKEEKGKLVSVHEVYTMNKYV